MDRAILLSILTPGGPLLSEEKVAWIQARLADGASIGIWPGHAPLLAETVAGPVRYSDGVSDHSLELQAGILHIDLAGATVLVPGTAGGAPETRRVPEQDSAERAASRSAVGGT